MLTDEQIKSQLNNTLSEAHFPELPNFYSGKVRDNYVFDNHRRVIIATDRVSAFDRILGEIPFKGQILNQLTLFWLEETNGICPNHFIASPDSNVTIARNVKVFPIEMVIRGYLTGSTSTSAWKNYEKGERIFCGNTLPEGLKKNDAFPIPIITPTTKAEQGEHDEKISKAEILEKGIIAPEKYFRLEEYTQKLFARGKTVAAKGGLILVDTKYEFGETANGQIVLVDEIHTPDSSRFWIADTYKQQIENGKEPDNFDKEFLRLWYEKRCDPYKDKELPIMPDDFRIEVAKRYIETYERLTGKEFTPEESNLPVKERIWKNLKNYLGI